MALQLMEGFESVVDHSDLVSRGWINKTNTTVNGNNVVGLPSRTGTAGRGIMLRGPYSTAAGAPMAAATTPDFGMLPLGSVNKLWQAGGFSLGFNGTFNKGTQLQIAPFYPNQIVYDGSQYYWALGATTIAWGVYYSTDLVNWTQTTTVCPAAASSALISVSGSGPTATVIVGQYLANGSTYYYTTNMGATWSSSSISGQKFRIVPTGNATTPYAFARQNPSPDQVDIGVMTAITGGAITYLTTLAFSNTGTAGYPYSLGTGKLVNGVVFLTGTLTGNAQASTLTTGAWWYSCQNTLDMTVAGNWVKSATTPGGLFNDITFFNNKWITTAASGGLYAAANTGTVGAPAGPNGAWSNVLSTASIMSSIDTNGSICVAVGQDNVNNNVGVIYTSTDGVTWTKANRLWASGAGGQNQNYFTQVLWDGSRFVIVGGANSNVIATSPDGINWNPIYYPDYPESNTANSSFAGVFAGTVNTSGNFSGWSTNATNNVGVGFSIAAVSGGTRTVGSYVLNGASTNSTAYGPNTAVSVSPLSHYFELIATAVAGSPNCFTYQLAIDGVITGSISGINNNSGLLALASDTGVTQLYFNLPRAGNLVMIDDLYLTDFATDAVGNTGQLGIINILGGQTNSDIQAQFTHMAGSAASNGAQVAGALSNAEGTVATFTVGAKDIYGTNLSIASNFKVQAVQVEAFVQRYGNSGGNAQLGIVSNGVEVDAPAVAANGLTPVFTSLLQTVDPKTNAQWTIAAAKAAGIAITKLT